MQEEIVRGGEMREDSGREKERERDRERQRETERERERKRERQTGERGEMLVHLNGEQSVFFLLRLLERLNPGGTPF